MKTGKESFFPCFFMIFAGYNERLMKKLWKDLIYSALIVLWMVCLAGVGWADELAVSVSDMILRPKHIYNFSGNITVRPDISQFGFYESFSPPYVAGPFQGIWKLDDQPIQVLHYTWSPSKTTFIGQAENDILLSLQLIPLAGPRAFVCKLILDNRGEKPFHDMLSFEMEGKIGKTDHWGWVPPSAGQSDTAKSIVKEALVLTSEKAQLAAAFQPSPTRFHKDHTACFAIDLPDGQKQEVLVLIALGKPEEAVQIANLLIREAEDKINESQQVWESRWNKLQDSLPKLVTGDKKFQQFYRRSLLTFQTATWGGEGFVFTPWYAESGIDGGAVCNYLWGDAYLSKFLPLADPAAARALLTASMKADYSTHYAIAPLTGEGIGVGYSYNYYSMALMVYDYVAITGDMGLLEETVRGRPFLDALCSYVFEREDLARPPELIDYGGNENLLELRRSRAYQHYTPSPNLERLLTYRMMDELYRKTGRQAPADLKDRAEQLKQVLIAELWDPELKWLRCLDEDRRPQVCWSIQIFDALRADLLNPEQAAGLVGHLNEREFLSEWGVHSLSKPDPGYDESDIDWGGPGVYAGDGPQLAEDLLGAGFTEQGIDVLRRILWWGEFPYIPQAVRADSRDYRQDGRANVIAALAGAQAIVWGLFGIQADLEQVTINPVEHPYTAGMGVENLNIRGRHIKIAIDADGRHYSVDADGQITRKPIGSPFVLKFK